MITTNIHYEVTDTYDGVVNYSWVKIGIIEGKEGEDCSDLAAVRRVKKAIGWNGEKCKVEKYGDGLILKPVGICQVCFISFDPHGSAS